MRRVIPAPYWVSYPDMVLLADGLPVMPFAGMAQGYKITPRQLEAAITPRRACCYSTVPAIRPARPTRARNCKAWGKCCSSIRASSSAPMTCTRRSTGSRRRSAACVTAVPELYPRTVTINGVSKAYAMTGWRIGYCGGPKELIHAMGTIQGQSTSNASSISQKAATVALNGDQACVGSMNAAFKERRDFVVRALNYAPRRQLPAGRRHVLCLCGGLARHDGARLPRRRLSSRNCS